MKFFLLLFSISLAAHANLDMAPPTIIQENGQRLVFVDFLKAKYELKFDIKNAVATSRATIEFENREEGYPLFDVIATPYFVSLDGVQTTTTEIEKPIQMHFVNIKTPPGRHKLVVENVIPRYEYTDRNDQTRWTSGVNFDGFKMRAKFDLNDGADRYF